MHSKTRIENNLHWGTEAAALNLQVSWFQICKIATTNTQVKRK